MGMQNSPNDAPRIAADALVIRVCSWNVAEIAVEDVQTSRSCVRDWLLGEGVERRRPDVIAVGLQEVDMSAKALLQERTKPGVEWAKLLTECLQGGAEKYTLVASDQLTGIALFIFAESASVYPFIDNVEVLPIRTGFFYAFGNKGALCSRFAFRRKSFCFVNCHLAAHQRRVKRRNKDHHRILKHATFQREPARLLAHDTVFWFGDLNYRLEMTRDEVISKYCQEGGFTGPPVDELLEDQLMLQMKVRRAFAHFTESKIMFPPTYKMKPTALNEYLAARSPAYCDRILFTTSIKKDQDSPLRPPSKSDITSASSCSSSSRDSDDGVVDVDTVFCVVCRSPQSTRLAELRKSGWKCFECVGKKSKRSRWVDFDEQSSASMVHPRDLYPRLAVACVEYCSDPSLNVSDHRPIHGLFAVPGVFS
ncbi:Polyphosphatidylinositol phosphatase INP52 [Diplonema papillatum]|nr:Polyphosphatidylinositol phosphatase INP52 [Diplonema papillatum]